MSAKERAAFAAIQGHAEVCPRCRDGDDGCPEAAALYRAWRPTLNLAPPGGRS
ncbi:hypothetical protein [Streptomyces sp. NPDC088674]|uniref:hypothetical protein n=1 Tax=Streptomyces sp. NPDC088674 TaxID=3365869 RepID=UPI0037FB27FE